MQFPQNTDSDSAALAAQSKSADDIIKSSKFPAAHAPRPDETAKIETDYWPCPPSLAALGTVLLLSPQGPTAQINPYSNQKLMEAFCELNNALKTMYIENSWIPAGKAWLLTPRTSCDDSKEEHYTLDCKDLPTLINPIRFQSTNHYTTQFIHDLLLYYVFNSRCHFLFHCLVSMRIAEPRGSI